MFGKGIKENKNMQDIYLMQYKENLLPLVAEM